MAGLWVGRLVTGISGAHGAQRAFTRSLFRALGHMSKADGRVSRAEIQAVESLMAQMGVTGEQRQEAIRNFNAGKSPGFDLAGELGDFNRHTVFRQDLRVMFLEILIQLGAVDGALNAAEREVLIHVARVLQIPSSDFTAMLHRWSGSGGPHQAGGQAPGPSSGVSLQQAYATLGVAESASDAEVKRAYRKLVAKFHPDRLVSRGLPEEMMEMAKARARDINTAYDQVQAARKNR